MAIRPKRHPVPYQHDLNTKLLRLGKKDYFTLRMAVENVLISGGVGSGKTSGSAAAYFEALLNAGCGGLVLCAKPDEAARVLKALKKAGRQKDALVVDASGKERFNFMDYAAATLAADGFEHNLTELLKETATVSDVASANSGGGENSFFRDGALKWFSHAAPLLLAAYNNLRLKDVYELVVSAPKNAEEAVSPDWQNRSFCYRTLITAHQQAEQGNARAVRAMEEHADFWTEEYAHLADRTRSAIEATLTNLIYPFLSGKLAELFCTHTTVVPEMARHGKIIILDLPVLTYGPMGATAQSIFKYLFGLAMQREVVIDKTRLVFLWADECQFFLSPSDAELLSTCRSQRICCTYITQDTPTFYAMLGHKKRDIADSIIGKFGTRIFHSNTSKQTNEEASQLIGKTTRFNSSATTSRGLNSGGSVNQNGWRNGAGAGDGRNQSQTQSISSYEDYVFPPEFFAKGLRTGGPKNKKKVEAIVVRSGANFKATGAHWLKAEFRQD